MTIWWSIFPQRWTGPYPPWSIRVSEPGWFDEGAVVALYQGKVVAQVDCHRYAELAQWVVDYALFMGTAITSWEPWERHTPTGGGGYGAADDGFVSSMLLLSVAAGSAAIVAPSC